MNGVKTMMAALAAAVLSLQAAQVPKKMNILCVCAHPDDAEISCGGTLLKYAKQGHNIYIALTTSGNTGSNTLTDIKEIERVREAEMLASAKIYNAKVRFLRNDDERLLDTNETRTQVLDALRWADPDVVFTHNPDDESPDHWMTSHLVRAMILSMPGRNQQSHEKPCLKKCSVFMWGKSKGLGFVPEAYVDVTDEMDEVCRACNLHESQKAWLQFVHGNKPDLSISKRIVARFFGNQVGCEYAEGFVGLRLNGYMPNFRLLP